MDFIISREFVEWRRIRALGDRYFRSLPEWAQNAPDGNVTVIIGHSKETTEDTLRRELHKITRNMTVVVFPGDIRDNYKEFFAQYIKKVIHSDPTLNAVFLRHMRTVTVPGISNGSVVEQLFMHFAWYLIDPSSLHHYNPQRFEFCQKIGKDLVFAVLPQGTLQ